MAWMNPRQTRLCESFSELAYCNPFTPERIQIEKKILGRSFEEENEVWHIGTDADQPRPNIAKLREKAHELTDELLEQNPQKIQNENEWDLYEDLVLFLVYHNCNLSFEAAIASQNTSEAQKHLDEAWEIFQLGLKRYFKLVPEHHTPLDHEHLFACFYQVRRAFHYIFMALAGSSPAIARLRADIWNSVFTLDLKRYRTYLWKTMGDFATLITGPSGTGKELVARAIGLSRYIPYRSGDQSFVGDHQKAFLPLNLSALSPTLIESELFGHTRGSFTGASKDRTGWLEVCPPMGSVFLDEIGELDPAIQVKLLRVLQTRTFQRVGDNEEKKFKGKVLAATNRNLSQEMESGRFRQDLYYRLCSDIIETPSLYNILKESPDELHRMVLFILQRILNHNHASELAQEVVETIRREVPPNHPWPGNFRELEQCLRNILIRGTYQPPKKSTLQGTQEAWVAQMVEGELKAEELMQYYCQKIYKMTGSYEEAARKLDLDRRTVRAKVLES